MNHGQQVARSMRNVAQYADSVTLWRFHDHEHGEAVVEGLCSVTLREYRSRLAGATAEFEQQGIPVRIVHATVAQILDSHRRHGLPLTPDGKAAAIGLLASEIL